MANGNPTPKVENIAYDAMRFRPKQIGIAIDSPETRRPEDAITASAQTDGSFNFAASVIEVGILDKWGDSVRKLVDQLALGEEPYLELPQERGGFYFYGHLYMPALTLTGNFRPDKGLSDLDIVRTKLCPDHYKYNSRALHTNDRYQKASRFVHAFQKYSFNKTLANPKHSFMKPSTTVCTFANLINIGVAQLTREAKLPQLLNTYPAVTVLNDGSELVTRHVTPEPLGHASFKVDDYTGVTNPIRDVRSWINQVAITHFMETGESIISYDEAQLISNWFNHRHKERLERKREKAQLMQSA